MPKGKSSTSQKETPSKSGSRKRTADQISEGETTEESPDSFETNVIPASDPLFQGSLLHLISVMLHQLRRTCSSGELEEGSEYLLTDLNVGAGYLSQNRMSDWRGCTLTVWRSTQKTTFCPSSPSSVLRKSSV